MSRPKAHLRSVRLHVNAGMSYPVCRANDRLLDLDAGRWPTTTATWEVTCRACIRAVALVRCHCGMLTFWNRMHYPGNDPENGAAHSPRHLPYEEGGLRFGHDGKPEPPEPVDETTRPPNLGTLNRWVHTWTNATVYKHWEADGGTLYWCNGQASPFYRQTVDGYTQPWQMTYAQWREDFMSRMHDPRSVGAYPTMGGDQ